MQEPSLCTKCETRHFSSQACPARAAKSALAERALGLGQFAREAAAQVRAREKNSVTPASTVHQKLDPSLAGFLMDVLGLRDKRGGTLPALAELEALMRRDEPFAVAESGVQQAHYKNYLARSFIEDAGDGFFEESTGFSDVSKIRYRLYVNALPSAAEKIFTYLLPRLGKSIPGLIRVKIAGSGSWKGRRDMVVGYFIDAKSACDAASSLASQLTSKQGWPDAWVRRDVLPGTFKVASGLGVAWDPQHLFLDDFNKLLYEELCFGTTHTERYANMILTFLTQRASGPAKKQVALALAEWMREYADPAKPYNPPPVMLNGEGFTEEALD